MNNYEDNLKETYLFLYDSYCSSFVCEANDFLDAIKQLAEYTGIHLPLFYKALKGMETKEDIIELYNYFSEGEYELNKIYIIKEVIM